jgi:hypothetical protein
VVACIRYKLLGLIIILGGAFLQGRRSALRVADRTRS